MMKNLVVLISAALIVLSACNVLPAATRLSPTPIPPTFTPVPPTPTSLPGLLERFGAQQLILDKLVVQGTAVVIPAGLSATITFGQDGKVTGSGGCNRFFGGFESSAPGQVKFGAMGATKMFCQDKMAVEDGFFNAMDKVTRYRVENIRLILESGDGQYLISFYVPVK